MKTIVTFEASNDKELAKDLPIEKMEKLSIIGWQLLLDYMVSRSPGDTAKVISVKIEP